MPYSLTGWDITKAADVDWSPWGPRGEAQARLLASADGFNVTIVRAPAGYVEPSHAHDFPEFLYVIAGAVSVQGHLLEAGDAYAAGTGSLHEELRSAGGAMYLSISKL